MKLTGCPFFSLTFGIKEHTKHCSMSFLYSSTRNDMLQCFVCSPIPNVSEKRGNQSEFHSEINYYLQNWYFRGHFFALGSSNSECARGIQNIFRLLFTVIFKPKIVISRVELVLVWL